MIRGGSLSAGLTRGDGKHDKFVEPLASALLPIAWIETIATIPSDKDPVSERIKFGKSLTSVR